ncbi:MAG: glycosyltransferase [Devosiaceae bacterium]|nr:glycosyltransferase [Devosiaceae bacterium MH13]
MKIVVQSHFYFPHEVGGAERSSRDLARGLTARGHDVSVLVADASRSYPERVDDLPVYPLSGLPLGRSPLWAERSFVQRALWNVRSEIDPVLLAKLYAHLKREKPDCVVMNNAAGHGSALVLAARFARVPIVPVLRDYGWFCAYGVMVRDGKNCTTLCRSCRTFSTLRRRLLAGLPCIAISAYVAETVKRHVLGARVEVIPNAVPDEVVEAPKPKPSGDLAGGRPLQFGYIGRMHPTKGVDALIDGWRKSEIWRQGHTLSLAGDASSMELPADLPEIGVMALGKQEPIAFLDQLDALIVPSNWGEPFGRTVVEGLARGLYLIGSPYGAVPTLIPEGHGEVLAAINADAIAEVFGRLADDPAPIAQAQARDRFEAVAPFRQAEMFARYEAALEAVVAAHAPS